MKTAKYKSAVLPKTYYIRINRNLRQQDSTCNSVSSSHSIYTPHPSPSLYLVTNPGPVIAPTEYQSAISKDVDGNTPIIEFQPVELLPTFVGNDYIAKSDNIICPTLLSRKAWTRILLLSDPRTVISSPLRKSLRTTIYKSIVVQDVRSLALEDNIQITRLQLNRIPSTTYFQARRFEKGNFNHELQNFSQSHSTADIPDWMIQMQILIEANDHKLHKKKTNVQQQKPKRNRNVSRGSKLSEASC